MYFCTSSLFVEYNFNSVSYCKKGDTYKKSLDEDERAIVRVKPPGTGIGATLNKALGNIPDRCSMRFDPTLLSLKTRMQVR